MGEYTQSLEKLTSRKKDLDKSKVAAVLDKRIKDERLKGLRARLPSSIDNILDLEKYWAHLVDDYERANSNYWMYHLQKQVLMLTKKELQLYNFKNMGCFFQQKLLMKSDNSAELSNKLRKYEDELLGEGKTKKRLKFFKNENVEIYEKYLGWKVLNLDYRKS